VSPLTNQSLPWKRVRCSLWPIVACQREGEVEGINEEVCGMWRGGKRLEFWKLENPLA